MIGNPMIYVNTSRLNWVNSDWDILKPDDIRLNDPNHEITWHYNFVIIITKPDQELYVRTGPLSMGFGVGLRVNKQLLYTNNPPTHTDTLINQLYLSDTWLHIYLQTVAEPVVCLLTYTYHDRINQPCLLSYLFVGIISVLSGYQRLV